MKESYGEDLASHSGLDPYADCGNAVGVASARGTGRPAIELRHHPFRVPTLWCLREGNTRVCAIGKRTRGTTESQNLRMSENSKRENREILFVSTRRVRHAVRRCRTAARWNGRKTSQTVHLT
jgi:hypothetical protein